jgi:hypothetical protein
MNIKEGLLIGNNTQNMEKEEIKKLIKPFKKFREYNVENLLTYHLGPFNDDPKQKIKELV